MHGVINVSGVCKTALVNMTEGIGEMHQQKKLYLEPKLNCKAMLGTLQEYAILQP